MLKTFLVRVEIDSGIVTHYEKNIMGESSVSIVKERLEVRFYQEHPKEPYNYGSGGFYQWEKYDTEDTENSLHFVQRLYENGEEPKNVGRAHFTISDVVLKGNIYVFDRVVRTKHDVHPTFSGDPYSYEYLSEEYIPE